MDCKGLLITFWLLASGLPAASQFQNILIHEQEEGGGPLYDPTIAIHPRDTRIMVAASALGNVYRTQDGGKTWTIDKLSSPLGVSGDPLVIAGPKGDFYYFHLSNPPTEGGEEGAAFDRIVVQASDDDGETWSTGESIGFNATKEQRKAWVTADARGDLYITWTQFDQFGSSDATCASNVLFSMSKNGKKWTDPVTISQVSGNCLDDGNTAAGAVPVVTFDGKVVTAWSHQGRIFLDRSFNGGGLWLSNDIPVTEQIGSRQFVIPGHGSCNNMPVLATDASKGSFRGSLYLVWADQRNGVDDADIWITRSHNFGDNWSTPMRINNDSVGKHQYMPWIAVDQQTGYVYVLYYDRRNHDGQETDVYLAFSTDGGSSFQNVRISEQPFTPQQDQSPGDHNHIAAHKGVIVPVWTRMDDGNTSIWTAPILHEDLVKAVASETK